MKHIFIVNPHAGAQSCEALVRQSLQPYDGTVDCEIYVKQHKGDSREVVRHYRTAFPHEELRFYACGGDGTLREVAIACIGVENVAFTAFAQGSGNDYVKYYGGADNFRNIGRLLSGTKTPIDVMSVTAKSAAPDHTMLSTETWAMNATHFGLDAKVAVTMNRLRRVPLIGKRMAYPTAVVWGFLTAMRNPCEVWADGVKLNDKVILLCTAANGSHVGGSYNCAPRSLNDDGLMEVCLVRPLPRLKFLRMMDDYKLGRHIDNPKFAPYITYLRARTLTIEGPEGFCISLDGEIVYGTHFDVVNKQHALQFITPE